LAAAETTPSALVAMVRANALNTPRLPVISLIAAIPVAVFRQIGSGLF